MPNAVRDKQGRFVKGQNLGENHPRWARVEKVCLYCGNIFEVHKSRESTAKFHSTICHDLWRHENVKGNKVHNWKPKVSKVCLNCGEVFNVLPCDSDRKYHSQKCMGLSHRKNFSGSNSWNWKGGRTELSHQVRNSFKYRQWRCDVFTRDDFTCQECGRRGGALEAHHTPEDFVDIMEINDVKTYSQALECEELWNINGGVTLCRKCHDQTKKKC